MASSSRRPLGSTSRWRRQRRCRCRGRRRTPSVGSSSIGSRTVRRPISSASSTLVGVETGRAVPERRGRSRRARARATAGARGPTTSARAAGRRRPGGRGRSRGRSRALGRRARGTPGAACTSPPSPRASGRACPVEVVLDVGAAALHEVCRRAVAGGARSARPARSSGRSPNAGSRSARSERKASSLPLCGVAVTRIRWRSGLAASPSSELVALVAGAAPDPATRRRCAPRRRSRARGRRGGSRRGGGPT